MRIRRVMILSAVLLVVLLVAAIPTAHAQQRIHIVQPGETLSGIALRYGVTVQQIASVNNIVNPSLIFVGQRLIIPGEEPPPPTGGTTTYTVQRGDNLTIIARRFNTTVATLVRLNGIANPSLIFVGQVLVVPAPDGQPDPTAVPQPTATSAQPAPTATPVPEQVTYTVVRGDTLSAIALRFGVTVQELVMLNNIANPSLIFPGQVLIIRQAPTPPPTATATSTATQSGPTATATLSPTPAPPTATQPPPTATEAPPRLTHTVVRGETLSGIALRYGVTVQELVQLNNIANPSLIFPGQVLIIRPGPQPTATPVPPTPTVAPTNTPDPNATPTASPTPLPGGIPTPTPIVRPTSQAEPGPNLFANAGFEGNSRPVGPANVVVLGGWQPFYCAQPYTGAACPALRRGQGNPADLLMGRPSFSPVTAANRVYANSSAQSWACRYITCRAGVFQTVETEPGSQCEAGAYIQSLSSHSSDLTSDLDLGSDRENSQWRIIVDLNGGTNAFAQGNNMLASRTFSYDDGVYDSYALMRYSFTATGDETTVFFEDVRLWPFSRNVSYIDNAYVRCTAP